MKKDSYLVSDAKAYVYLIRSLKTKRFYLGWTTDLKHRIYEHNNGESFHTKAKGPWGFIAYEAFSTKEQAKARERKLKRNPRMYFLFKKRALEFFLKGYVIRSNTQQRGMIPPPVYRPDPTTYSWPERPMPQRGMNRWWDERPIPPLAEKQVVG